LCWEVNFVDAYSFVTFEEGWVNYVFNNPSVPVVVSTQSLDTTGLFYSGAPVLATYLYLGGNGMTGDYGAWTDTPVSDDAGLLVNYQYTAFSN
jgi:hypothetical protein